MFEKDNSRKIQCFVCGIFYDYNELEALKEHIITTHREKEEFLLCSLCKFPVRDMKLHWKAKHPGLKIPPCQMRPLVWKDFTKGKTKTKKPKFITGNFVSTKMGGRIMHYRSSLELLVISEICERDQRILQFFIESLTIKYWFNNKWRNYFPDILVKFFDHTELWEIKPASLKFTPMNQQKFLAATQYCQSAGIEFKVMTESEIYSLRNKILLEQRNNS